MKTWYLGLDIGTSSVGWAVSDEQYNIPRLRGQRAWGVRLFEEAQTAADRRLYRIARRRYYRRAERLSYLRVIFAHYIEEIDPGFFARMGDSSLWAEDKHEQQQNSLFADPDYTDADYFGDFPTIFHLRDYLMDPKAHEWKPRKLDARHYYLACHNIIKYRGHFLFEGEHEIDAENTEDKFIELYARLQAAVLEAGGFKFTSVFAEDPNTEDGVIERNFSEVLLELLSAKGRLTDKKSVAKTVTIDSDADEDERESIERTATSIAQFLIGAKTDFGKLLNKEDKIEIQLGRADMDKQIIAAADSLDEDWQSVLYTAKQLFEIGIARQIIGGSASLSASYIDLYDQYKEDLDLYNRGEETKDKQVHALNKERHADLIENRGSKSVAKPKLRGYYEGAIPMQMHLTELKKILQSLIADERYTAFAEANTEFKDDLSLSNVLDKDKIIKLLTHKVPYYVGPLQTKQTQGKKAKTSRQEPWCERKPGQDCTKIYPWNFDMVINKTACAENFIQRMTNKCTYLVDQPCLPKESILYQRYLILNELNKMRIDGRPIDVQRKKDVFNDLFMKRTDIKLATIKDYFSSKDDRGDISIADSLGTGGVINHKMTSYLKFKKVFGDMTDELIPKIEEAILSATILPDDKKMLHKRISNIFTDELDKGIISNDDIRRISSFNFSKWGRLSAKLLNSITAPIDGVDATIIDALWETNSNFMELISDSFGFKQQIDAYQNAYGYKSDKELINESYASVPVKRAARQAVKIVRELEQVIGSAPTKVFIETPRSNEKSMRTDNRKTQLAKIYENIKDDVADYSATKGELEDYEQNDLKPKAVYLYFLQNGRCAYCGEPLDIGSLSATCDIDHIVPQSLLKDDSFDNLVLVHKEENRTKGSTYPLNLIEKLNFAGMLAMWKTWHKNGLISDKKLKSLSRTALTIDEIAGFINRQIVETSQTTKMVMEVLKLVMPDTEVVPQKAETVSEFRREWAQYEGNLIDGRFRPTLDGDGNKQVIRCIKPRFTKVRDLNDLHHAKDAYLNIVVGNVYSARFTNNPLAWVRKQLGDNPNGNRNWNMRTVMYDDRTCEVKKVADHNGIIAWDESCLATVVRTYSRNDILVTMRSFIKQGKFYDATREKKSKDSKSLVPLKKRLAETSKYGGYTSSKPAGMTLIRYKKAKKTITQFVAVPVKRLNDYEKFLHEKYGEIEMLSEIIRIKTVFELKGEPKGELEGEQGGQLMLFTGISSDNTVEFYSFKQIIVSDTDYLQRVIKAHERKDYSRIDKSRNLKLINEIANTLRQYYSDLPNNRLITTLEQKQQTFINASPEDQCAVIVNLLRFFNRSVCNLKKIGGAGDYRFRIKLDLSKTKMLVTSITGLFRKTIDFSESLHSAHINQVEKTPDKAESCPYNLESAHTKKEPSPS
jgi:CRISPR-associated endonuclease Csn1